MSFYTKLQKLKKIDIEEFFDSLNEKKISDIIHKENLSELDFLALLSPLAKEYMEKIAIKARSLTLQYFGKTISLYLPLYISNYCENNCSYCGFSTANHIKREKLSLREIELEAKEIAKTNIKQILLLTGEAKQKTPLSYIKDAVLILQKYFSSVCIEVFPMEEEEYKELKEMGVDGLTIYQETYDENMYKKVHLSGKKSEFLYRLDTPERAAKIGIRSINIGPLYGLNKPIAEAFYSGVHAKYLMDKYIDTEIGISLPRINRAEGGFESVYSLDDKSLVQFILAFRLFLPRVSINISTREREFLRKNLIGLGVTKLSAGSKTCVGGYYKNAESTSQFETVDKRDANEITEMIKSKGYQAVYKDWEMI